jgi:uncharacterized protein DUF4403
MDSCPTIITTPSRTPTRPSSPSNPSPSYDTIPRTLSYHHHPLRSATAHPIPISRAVRTRILLIAAVLLAGCRDNVRIPPPGTGAAARPVPQPEPSTVNIPITVDLSSVAQQVEAGVPHGQNREDDWRPLGKYAVVGTVYVKEMWERDPLRLQIHGDHADVAAHVRYRARIAAHPCVPVAGCRWVQLASCGVDGPMPTLDIGLRTVLLWNRDWTVNPQTRARPVDPGIRCRLTEANIDVTDRVATLVQGLMDRIAPQVDEKIRDAAQLRRRVEGVWATAQQPIRAAKDVYLVLQPQSLAATKPAGEGTTIGTTVSLTLRPRVVLGDEPEVEEKPLPDSGEPTPGRGFHVALVAELPYTTANEILGKKLVGREFTVKGHRVKVRGARLYGGGSQVVLGVIVGGDARGELYFVGTPRFDPQTQVVSVPDLDYSVESRDVLPKVADWLLYDDLRDQMRAAAHFDVSERVDKIRADVNAALNRNLGSSVRMSGGVDAIRPLGVSVFASSLAAIVEADGHAQIHVDVGAPARPSSSSPEASLRR